MQALRNTAALIAAAAVIEIYPDVELLEVSSDDLQFFCDISSPHPFQEEVIEMKMREIIQRKEPIFPCEMVPFSASELFRDKNSFSRAQKVREMDSLVEMVRLGEFCDLSLGKYLEDTSALPCFKIELKEIEKNVVRILGWAHFSKSDLKQFLKKLFNYVPPFDRGKALGYWKEGVVLPLGLQKKRGLLRFLKKEWFEGAFEISSHTFLNRLQVHKEQGAWKVAEVFTDEFGKEHVQVSFFEISSEKRTSFLQLIDKTLTILGFDHSVSDQGAGDFFVLDALGRRQVLVSAEKEGDDWMVTACMEQILEQMIEKNLRVDLED